MRGCLAVGHHWVASVTSEVGAHHWLSHVRSRAGRVRHHWRRGYPHAHRWVALGPRSEIRRRVAHARVACWEFRLHLGRWGAHGIHSSRGLRCDHHRSSWS